MKPYILIAVPDALWFQHRGMMAPLAWKDYRQGPVFYRVAAILTACVVTPAHAIDEAALMRVIGGVQDSRILLHPCDDLEKACKVFGLVPERAEVVPE